jgi:hypothetical protein
MLQFVDLEQVVLTRQSLHQRNKNLGDVATLACQFAGRCGFPAFVYFSFPALSVSSIIASASLETHLNPPPLPLASLSFQLGNTVQRCRDISLMVM